MQFLSLIIYLIGIQHTDGISNVLVTIQLKLCVFYNYMWSLTASVNTGRPEAASWLLVKISMMSHSAECVLHTPLKSWYFVYFTFWRSNVSTKGKEAQYLQFILGLKNKKTENRKQKTKSESGLTSSIKKGTWIIQTYSSII